MISSDTLNCKMNHVIISTKENSFITNTHYYIILFVKLTTKNSRDSFEQ